MEDYKVSDEIDSSLEVLPPEEPEQLEDRLLPELPAAYGSNQYYTPIYVSEGFYTPWGKESLDQGMSYLRIVSVGLSGIFLFVFTLPFAIRVLSSLISHFQKIMSK